MDVERQKNSQQSENSSVFICHTGLDGAYVAKLASHLEREGVKCWYYERDNFGSSIGTAVDKALDKCDCLLFVMSKNLPEASIYVQNELNDYVRTRRKVIPLRVAMPEKWWPLGVRSLIGSIPVVEDRCESMDPIVVSEIKRRIVNNAKALGKAKVISSTNRRKKTPRTWLPFAIGIISILTCVIVAIVSLRKKADEPTEEDLRIIWEIKTSRMPQPDREKWDSLLLKLDKTEEELDEIDSEILKLKSQREVASRDLKAMEAAEEQSIGRASGKYQ